MRISQILTKSIALLSCAVALLCPALATAQTHSYAMPLAPAAVDYDFVMRMRDHSQGAIEAAKTELAHGDDKQLKKLARKVIEAQTKEIALLDAWMASHPEAAKDK